MIWFYERGSDTLRIETRFNPVTRFYELIWHRANGNRTIETFASEAMFRRRTDAVEVTLSGLEWQMAGAPTFVPEGWQRA